MANTTKKFLKSLTRHYSSIFSSPKTKTPFRQTPFHTLSHLLLQTPTSKNLQPIYSLHRHFSSFSGNNKPPQYPENSEDDNDEDGEEEDEMSEYSEEEEDEDCEGIRGVKGVVNRTYTVEEKEQEALGIGYKVVGPLDPTERPFKYREPYFAVVQIGSHQFKVSNGDTIYTEKLKFCEVNDKLILSKVLMVGSQSQTIIGRPILPDAAVHAVVEEHALDAKVIIFKKKRRKNYRRTKGHRQELTRLRITDIQGIDKPEMEKPEKVAVAA